MSPLEITIQEAAAASLKKDHPKFFDAVKVLITDQKQTPKQVDLFFQNRFGLRKGHPVRELAYQAALSIERKYKDAHAQ